MASWDLDSAVVAWLPFGFEVGWCSVDVFVADSWVLEGLDQRSVLGQMVARDNSIISFFLLLVSRAALMRT